MGSETKRGERALHGGPGVYSALLHGGPRDGEVVEAIGHGLPSDVRYPVNGDNAEREHRYTLRGTSATGYAYEYTGLVTYAR